MLTFAVVGQALLLLLVLGIVWLKEMLPRWRADLHTLRTGTDGTDRVVVGGLWVATVVIAGLVITFVVGIVRALARAL